MKAFQILEFGIEKLTVVDKDPPQPGLNQVLVKMRAASLNYRDLLLVKGQYDPKLRRPRVPLSDGVGIVEEVGSAVTRFKSGDRVAGIFMQDWTDGPVTRQKMLTALGGAIDGVLQELVLFSEDGLVSVPPSLSDEEAATLPCAGVTAWHAIFEHATPLIGETILLQGTGGVSIIALQLAKAAGLRTVITSSSDEKLERARSLGADETINYKTNPKWDEQARQLTGGIGVDYVIDVGGSDTIQRALRAVRLAGTISLIGILSGVQPSISPLDILMHSIRLQGIYVGSRAMFERLLKAISFHAIKPVIDKTFPWTDYPAALRYLEGQSHFGKVCLKF